MYCFPFVLPFCLSFYRRFGVFACYVCMVFEGAERMCIDMT
jgi:hypothetical protein